MLAALNHDNGPCIHNIAAALHRKDKHAGTSSQSRALPEYFNELLIQCAHVADLAVGSDG